MINTIGISEKEKTVVIDGEVYYLTKEKPIAVKDSSFERAKGTAEYYYISLRECYIKHYMYDNKWELF